LLLSLGFSLATLCRGCGGKVHATVTGEELAAEPLHRRSSMRRSFITSTSTETQWAALQLVQSHRTAGCLVLIEAAAAGFVVPVVTRFFAASACAACGRGEDRSRQARKHQARHLRSSSSVWRSFFMGGSQDECVHVESRYPVRAGTWRCLGCEHWSAS
jgi:hypothetical protein